MPNQQFYSDRPRNEVKRIVPISNHVTAFERTLHKSHLWIKEIHQELDWMSADSVYHLLRAVLHTIRDQLNTDEVAHFASQLPLLLRGTFYECWDPQDVNPRGMSKYEFMDSVRFHIGRVNRPFINSINLEVGVTLTLRVIFNHVSPGEMNDVIMAARPSLRTYYEHIQHFYD
ncbi:MAG: DUF2267 domain-containing protein [Bacteriovorax sp.]|jgi:uncharacterized protein (DUF2267 family)